MINLNVNVENKHFGDVNNVAIAQVDFAVQAQEFVAIVGPSGCGKTTLLNMIAGLEDATRQTIECTRSNVTDASLRVSYIFQQPRLMPWLTVTENIALVLADQQVDIEQLLEQVGLAGKGDYFPKQLSGGMQRRVSIARAFAIKPQLLLLDEPFASLDAPTASQLRQLLIKLCAEHGTTVLFVTHDLQEAIFLADRILFLSAAPSNLIYEDIIDIARPRQEFGADELSWQARLLAKYPLLLSGSIRSKT